MNGFGKELKIVYADTKNLKVTIVDGVEPFNRFEWHLIFQISRDNDRASGIVILWT